MIFITLGSQKFQFDRLLAAIDNLVESKKISDEIYAQIGYCTYKPKNFKYVEFMAQDDFREKLDKCDLVIAHGGTGAIITAVSLSKKVIAVPRLAIYQEHVDDHQIQLVEQFESAGIICGCYDVNELADKIMYTRTHEFTRFESNTSIIIDDIKEYIADN